MTAPLRPSARCRALFLELSRYLDGDLTPTRRRVIERHMKTCACCGTMADCLKRTVAACRDEGRRRLPPAVRARAAKRIRLLMDASAVPDPFASARTAPARSRRSHIGA